MKRGIQIEMESLMDGEISVVAIQCKDAIRISIRPGFGEWVLYNSTRIRKGDKQIIPVTRVER